MYKDIKSPTLFDDYKDINVDSGAQQLKKEVRKPEIKFQDVRKDEINKDSAITAKNKTPAVEKIVWFYDDNSFEEYYPNR